MKEGSLVECFIEFSPHVKLHCLAWGERAPEPGDQFIVEKIDRCDCGRHDVIGLDTKRIMHDARHFREIQTPGEADEIIAKLLNSEYATEKP